MLYSRLISDNPYRLLGIGSSASYRELLAKALSAEKAARVGLASEPGLADVFGANRPEAGILVGSVRSLANDPVALTTYRLAWMLEYPPAGLREESLPGLCRLAEESLSETPTQRHQCFLLGWWAFLQAPSPATLDKTLSFLTDWYEDGAFDEHFMSVLARDNGDLDSARNVLYEAQNSLIDHILQVGTTHAEDRWNAGDTAGSIALLRVLCEGWSDADQVHRVLKRVADLGERERARIDHLCRSFEGWTTASPMYDVGEVGPVLELAGVLGDYLPAAALWRTAVERRIDQVATAMRGCAIDLANDESDYAAARRILEHLQGFPLSDDWETRLAEDLETLSGLEAEVARKIDQVASAARSIALALANDKSDYDAARKVLERLRELPLNDDWNTIVAQDLQNLSEMEKATRASESTTSIVRCTSCGQMNRIPEHHADSVPACGRCRAILGPLVVPPASTSRTGMIGLVKRHSPWLVLLGLIGVVTHSYTRPTSLPVSQPPAIQEEPDHIQELRRRLVAEVAHHDALTTSWKSLLSRFSEIQSIRLAGDEDVKELESWSRRVDAEKAHRHALRVALKVGDPDYKDLVDGLDGLEKDFAADCKDIAASLQKLISDWKQRPDVSLEANRR